MITLYGISNCDTVKKARAWLTDNGHPYQFHDFRKSGVPPQIDDWIQAISWQKLLNRQGTTWRRLAPEVQAQIVDAVSARALMLAQPSVVKRPVVDWGNGLTVGFEPGVWAQRHSVQNR